MTLTIIEPAATGVAIYQAHADLLRGFIANDMSVADNRPLPIAVAVCHQLVAALEKALEPCGPKLATQHVDVMLGCYPRIEPHDPRRYATGLVSVMAEAPDDIARKAIDKITRTTKFAPTRAELHDVVSRMMAKRRIEKRAAEKLIAMHARRAEEAALRAELDAEKAERARRPA